MAARKDIKIDAGASFRVAFKLKDAEGNTLNISDYTASSHVKEKFDDISPLAVFIATSNLDDNSFILEMTPEQSIKLQKIKDGKKGVWDVFLESADGTIVRLTQRGYFKKKRPSLC